MMTTTAQTEILETLANMSADRTGYISLTSLRIELDHLDRATVDAELTEMAMYGRIALIRNDNTAELSRRDHEAALELGGNPRHLVRIR